MKNTSAPRVKICCIGSVEEAALAVELGASAIGLVSQMPSGPGVISDELIAEIAATVPPPIATFLLTSKQDVQAIIDQQRLCRTNCIQICDRIATGTHRELKRALPGIALIQVIHVTSRESIEEAVAAARDVDAILLDSGNQSLPVKELGGTGRRHDWALSREIRERIPVPMFLAGGLNAANAQAAVREVGSFGLDVCSGVRTDGKLDRAKLQAFFAAVRSAS